jgi:hypothetical protein
MGNNVNLYSAETFDPSMSYVTDVIYTRVVPMVSVGLFMMVIMISGQCPCIKRRRIQDVSKNTHAFILTLSAVLWAAVIGSLIAAAVTETQFRSKLKETSAMFDNVLAITASVDTVQVQLSATITALSTELTASINGLNSSAYKDAVATSVSLLGTLRQSVASFGDTDSISQNARSILSDISSPVDMIDIYSMIAVFSIAIKSALVATIMLTVAITQSTRRHIGPCVEKTNAVVAAIGVFLAFAVAAVYLLLATIGADFCKDPKENIIALEGVPPTAPLFNYLVKCNPAAAHSDLINVTYITPNLGPILYNVSTHPDNIDNTVSMNASVGQLATEVGRLDFLISCANVRGALEESLDYICHDIVDATVNLFLTVFIGACFVYILYVVTRQLPVHPLYGIKAAKEKQEISSSRIRVLKTGTQNGINWKITQVSAQSYALYTSKETHSDFIAYTFWKQLQATRCAGSTPSIVETYATPEYVVKVSKCNNGNSVVTWSEFTGITQ